MSEGLFFPQQTGSGSGSSTDTSDYVKDSFEDYVRPGTSNAGFSSTVATNPLGGKYADDNSVKYSTKTLWIKDLVEIEDDIQLGVENGKSYRVVFTENFNGIQGFVSGKVRLTDSINGKSLLLNATSTRFGITGIARKVMFLVQPATTTRSYALQVNGSSIGSVAVPASNEATVLDWRQSQRKWAVAEIPGLQSNNINTYTIQASTDPANITEILGVIIYFENSGANIDVFPGDSFINKQLVETASGATFAVPAQNASLFHLGAKSTVYKTLAGAYGVTTWPVPLLQTQATGVSGTNIVTVSTGTGGSFLADTGIMIQSGTSFYQGIVTARSTDSLTVSPTLSFGITGATMTKSFFRVPAMGQNGVTNQIGPDKYFEACSWNPALTYGASNWIGESPMYSDVGPTLGTFQYTPYLAYYDPENRYTVLPRAGASLIQGRMKLVEGQFGWEGPITIRGDFQAIAFQFYVGVSGGGSTFLSTVDGLGVTAQVLSVADGPWPKNVPLYYDLGIGNHTVTYQPSVGVTNVIITDVKFFKYKGAESSTLSAPMSSIEQNMSFVELPSHGVTSNPLGEWRYYGSDKLNYLSGSWEKRVSAFSVTLSSFPGFMEHVGNSTNSALSFRYWGSNFCLYGSAGNGSFAVTLDGLPITPTLNSVYSVPGGETLHVLGLQAAGPGGTFGIRGFGVFRNYQEIKCEQNFVPEQDLLELDGRKLVSNSVNVTKAAPRFIGPSVGIGGIALSAGISAASGISGNTAIITSSGIYIETSGNPVMLGFVSQPQVGGKFGIVAAATGSTLAASAVLNVFRLPNGSTLQITGEGASNTIQAVARFYSQVEASGAGAGTKSFATSIESFKTFDFVPAGRYFYQVSLNTAFAGATATINGAQLFAMEMF